MHVCTDPWQPKKEGLQLLSVSFNNKPTVYLTFSDKFISDSIRVVQTRLLLHLLSLLRWTRSTWSFQRPAKVQAVEESWWSFLGSKST